jgi:hypothetical protein
LPSVAGAALLGLDVHACHQLGGPSAPALSLLDDIEDDD